MPNSRPDRPAIYRIKVSGCLDRSWSAWFNDMTITIDSKSRDGPATMLTGRVADQAALRGLLSKIWDLNLVLISLARIEMNSVELAECDENRSQS